MCVAIVVVVIADVGCPSAPHGRSRGRRFRLGGSRRFGGTRATAARRGSWRRLGLFGTYPLFALPTGADTGYLIVGQQRQMAANRHVHLAQQCDHLIS
jgi:hypothetical protein